MGTSRSDRRAFLDERRALSEQRFDTLHSSHYDEQWGAIDPSHAQYVARLVEEVPERGRAVDVACGTGKYWPLLLAAGVTVTGIDQSAGMLAQAARKYPAVETRRLAFQELTDAVDLRMSFDALLCVDALECVGPEDWPVAAAGLANLLRHGSPAYVTVELVTEEAPPRSDPRQVAGEHVDGGFYHYYPRAESVRTWLSDAGFDIAEESEADGYRHLLMIRR
jgi:SAM-dependent methyltransferase